MTSRMPKPQPMTATEAHEANLRMVDRMVAEGHRPALAVKRNAPKPKPPTPAETAGTDEETHPAPCWFPYNRTCTCNEPFEGETTPAPLAPEREAAKARVRAKVEAREAMPARERIYHLLCATYTHTEADALLAEVENNSPELERAEAQRDFYRASMGTAGRALARRVEIAERIYADLQQARQRIADLQAERHSTNAALADLTVAHRAERDSATAEVTSSHAQWEHWASEAEELAAELDSVRTESEKRRRRMVAAEGDLMDIRGSLSPSGRPRKVPMELGERVAPAVDWLLTRVAELEKRLHDAAMTRVWTNEDGKKFVFVEDLASHLLGINSEQRYRAGQLAEQRHQFLDLDPDSACRPAGFTCPTATPEVAR